jgi:hypothetical protein
MLTQLPGFYKTFIWRLVEDYTTPGKHPVVPFFESDGSNEPPWINETLFIS